MAQPPLAALTTHATIPCSWLLGLSAGRLSDTYCLVLIIDDDATGTMGEDKCNNQCKMLQKVRETSPLAAGGPETAGEASNWVCLQPNMVRVTESQ